MFGVNREKLKVGLRVSVTIYYTVLKTHFHDDDIFVLILKWLTDLNTLTC